MGRTRSFDRDRVVSVAAATFLLTGYEGTSVDDLVTATGVHRGSLYQTFGSKRGLFLAALTAAVARETPTEADLDLLLVALLDVAPADERVREICGGAVDRLTDAPGTLGRRLIRRAGLDQGDPR